jgi:putative membrane protein insertion efficiency factor
VNPLQHILILVVRTYRLVLSPAQIFLFGSSGGCRFTPTCSTYAMEAVREHGAMNGTFLATKRVCRCHPWGDCGHDPVPQKRKTESGSLQPAAHSPLVTF